MVSRGCNHAHLYYLYMNEQLTRSIRARHTKNMDDTVENLNLTPVGEALAAADKIMDSLERSISKNIDEKAKNEADDRAEEERKAQESKTKKEAEEKIRAQLEAAQKDADKADVSEDKEKSFDDLIAKLPAEEQEAYLGILNTITDSTQRLSFIDSIRALVAGEADSVVEPIDTDSLSVSKIVGEKSLNDFLAKKITPKVKKVTTGMLEVLREQGADARVLDSSELSIADAYKSVQVDLNKAAKEGKWKKVQRIITQMNQELDSQQETIDEEAQREFDRQIEIEQVLKEDKKTAAKARFQVGEKVLQGDTEEDVVIQEDPTESPVLDAQVLREEYTRPATPRVEIIAKAKQRFEDAAAGVATTSEAESELKVKETTVVETEEKLSGKLGIAKEVVQANAAISDEDIEARYSKAEEVLKPTGLESLSATLKEGIREAHEVGRGEKGRDGRDAGIYNFTLGQLKRKNKILLDAGFNQEQIRLLMEHGITGAGDRGGMGGLTSEKYPFAGISSDTTGDFDPTEFTRYSSTGTEISKDSRSGRSTYERYGGAGDFYVPEALDKGLATVIQADAGRTVEDYASSWQAEYSSDTIDSPYSYLNAQLHDDEGFSIKRFNAAIFSEMQRIHTFSESTSDDVRHTLNESLRALGSGLQVLRELEQRSFDLQKELSTLREQYWQTDGSRDVRSKIQDVEKRIAQLETKFRNTAQPLINQADMSVGSAQRAGKTKNTRARSGSGSTGEGSEGGDGGGNNSGPGRNGPERGNGAIDGGDAGGGHEVRRLRGRGEGEDVEEDPMGRSVRSIEDLGHFMEKLVADYEGKIMATLYRGKDDGSWVTEEELYAQFEELQYPSNATEAQKQEINTLRESLKLKNRLYAYKVSQGEYARDFEGLATPQDQEGKNKVLMLTLDEIVQEFYESEKRTFQNGTVESPEAFRKRVTTRGGGQNSKDYWEVVKVVKPDQFMKWIRSYWSLIHNDDPDNPLNFFSEIMVNHPDQRGAVQAGRMHKDHGTFLRSRFLTDPTNGDLRVYDKLRDQIINEVWVPGGERNKEVLYKKIMHADEELPKQVRDAIMGDNLMAKRAAGGKNTMEMFFTLPENFRDSFDWKTGEIIRDGDARNKEDVRFGSAILLAYEMYYNIGDFKGMQELLGKNASFFNRDAITRATLEAAGLPQVDDLTKFEHTGPNGEKIDSYQAAKNYLNRVNQASEGTVIEGSLYDPVTGLVKNDEKTLEKWLTFMNPYYPVQKDDEMLRVIRKVVENQIHEMTKIPKSSSGSELAELHAYLRTYHDGVAARHDFRMGNRNSQTKYEFLGAPGGYQDKQSPRDRAGNSYNKGLVWRSTVGVLHAMPTRNGETVQDVLANATKIQMRALQPYNDALERAKRAEGKAIFAQIDSGTVNSGSKKVAELMGQIAQVNLEINTKLEGLSSAQDKKKSDLYALKVQVQELLLRENNSEVGAAWKTYTESEDDTFKRYSTVLKGLNFEEMQYAQYGGMHYSNSTGIFHMEMNSNDLPMDKISGRDHYGRIFFKTEEFGPWLEESEKKMRYSIETWPLPLGAMERRLVNPRSKGAPKYVDLPMIETVFGSYDYTGARNGGVMGMAQMMINRQRAKDGKEPIWFTDGKGNVAEVHAVHHGKTDPLGNPEMNAEWESETTLARRQKLREVVGYMEYDAEGNIVKYHDPVVKDPASYFTRAYVKTRIANFLLSHTKRYSPYEYWSASQREDFIQTLYYTNYFSDEDIEDIRKFSKNGYWYNFRKEMNKYLWKDLGKGIWDALSTFFKGAMS